MHPQACGQAVAPCSWCTGKPARARTNGDVQDVRITGIPHENARLAIRLVGATPRSVLSEAHRKALAASNTGTRFKPKSNGSKSSSQSVPAPAEAGAVGRVRETALLPPECPSSNEERPV